MLLMAGVASAQPRTITTEVSISQKDLIGPPPIPLGKVIESGRQFFAVPYRGTNVNIEVTPDQSVTDGHGEGQAGPRSLQRAMTWPNWKANDPSYDIPFLRLNGIDSQSCFECHNSVGVYTPPGSSAMTRRPHTVGGAGGFSVELFQNGTWPIPQPPDMRIMNVIRNPPHVFGEGYVQRVGTEMSHDLMAIGATLLENAKKNPGMTFSKPLESKGVKFGQYSVTCPDAACAAPEISGVEGVSNDLIVRPLQHKGIASTVRHFVMSALDFHFSMQAVEVVGINNDCDKDGLFNEMAVNLTNSSGSANDLAVQRSLGNVAALSAFVTMMRPPTQVNSDDPQVQRGRKLFQRVKCTGCHVPDLPIDDPTLTIQLPPPLNPASCPVESMLGSNTVSSPDQHPVVVLAKALQTAALPTAPLPTACPTGFYCIDLNDPGPGLPSDSYPRLRLTDGQLLVPLYSDLKRHRMGDNLAQAGPEQANDSGDPVPNNQWLTSKLWGLADSGPWLHDGRARTLNQAILWHAGPNSEANPVIARYKTLPPQQQQALIAFLESLRLPPPGEPPN